MQDEVHDGRGERDLADTADTAVPPAHGRRRSDGRLRPRSNESDERDTSTAQDDDTVIRQRPADADADADADGDALGATIIRQRHGLGPRGDGSGGAGLRGADARRADTPGRSPEALPAPALRGPRTGRRTSADELAAAVAAADDLADAVAAAGAREPAVHSGEPTRGAGAGLPTGPSQTPRVPSIRVGGTTVVLDRPVIVGRRPTLPRIVRGPEPLLVTVPSPHGQVSSSHVSVHAEGSAVVVEDLRSTNGTVVRPAGAPPHRMPSGASNVVLTGTVVEIGDGAVIEVMSPHHRAATPHHDRDPAP